VNDILERLINCKNHNCAPSAETTNDAITKIKELEKENKDLKRKYSELSDFDLQIRLSALADLKKAFTFRGHLENSIQPEELEGYIEKITKGDR